MITLPDKLHTLPFVTILHQSDGLLLARKRVTAPLYDRPSYLRQHVVSLVTAGRQRLRDDEGRSRQFTPGTVGLIRRGLYTVSDLLPDDGPFEVTLVYFDEKMLCGHPPGPRVPAQPHSSVPTNRPDLLRYLAALPGIDALTAAPRRQDPLDFLQRHYDKPLTLEDFALLTGASVSTFQRSFRARTGTSPRRWIIARRMERARELAAEGLAVSDIAPAVGYANTSHFIEQFRKTYGTTPGQV